jgi:hypothetical protein
MIRLVGGVVLVLVAAVSCACWFQNSTQSGTAAGKAKEPHEESVADYDEIPFDAKRAMGYLEAICQIGPRISGTEGMKKQQELLQKHFEAVGGQLTWQRFEAQRKTWRQPVPMANLIVSWHPDRERRVILCSHYDTRPGAHQEPNPRDWEKPFLSANDGGSGVALLMELAHHMKEVKTAVGVDFVIFDGEEYVFTPHASIDDYFFGSKHFAQQYKKSQTKTKYLGAVLMDMIGGKHAQFPIEPNSLTLAGALTGELWKIADELKCDAFLKDYGRAAEDDHLALNRAGIPAVDIIDFEYPHWHRLTDVPENCSGDSMKQVARVLTVWLQRVK